METSFAPANLNPNQSALVMIEFQREWLDEDIGKLNDLIEDRAQLEKSRQGAQKALRSARKNGAHVVHAPCLFENDYPEIGGQRPAGLFHAIPDAGTWTGEGCAFAEGFKPDEKEFVVKGRVGASTFAHSNLDAYLRNNGITDLYLAGYALHVCVESTLRQGHDLGYTMHVIEDATSAFTNEQREHVLQSVVHHFGDHLTADIFAQMFSSSRVSA